MSENICQYVCVCLCLCGCVCVCVFILCVCVCVCTGNLEDALRMSENMKSEGFVVTADTMSGNSVMSHTCEGVMSHTFE